MNPDAKIFNKGDVFKRILDPCYEKYALFVLNFQVDCC